MNKKKNTVTRHQDCQQLRCTCSSCTTGRLCKKEYNCFCQRPDWLIPPKESRMQKRIFPLAGPCRALSGLAGPCRASSGLGTSLKMDDASTHLWLIEKFCMQSRARAREAPCTFAALKTLVAAHQLQADVFSCLRISEEPH